MPGPDQGETPRHGPDAQKLVGEQLEEIGQRRNELEDALAELDLAIESILMEAVNEEQVRNALAHVAEVFEALPPYRRKDLVRLVLVKAEVFTENLKLVFRGRPPDVEVLKRGEIERDAAPRSETSKWLLGLMSQSPVVCDLTDLRVTRGLWYVLRLSLAA